MKGEEENAESLPFDLIIEILTRLPAKDLARFRCLSKLYDSTLRGRNFIESFFTISLSRPKLLFTCLKYHETFFFSSPQPQNSSPLAAKFQMSFPSNSPSLICRSVCGLVCGLNEILPWARLGSVPLICKPSTGQFFTLPKIESTMQVLKCCLMYDPIGKQHKVLNVSYSYVFDSESYQILTLGDEEELLWRTIDCAIPHEPCSVSCRNGTSVYDEICISGVCYYFARLHMGGVPIIICFDIRLEKFKSIRHDDSYPTNVDGTLINYKDNLAQLYFHLVGGVYTSIHLRVLKNAEKHEWSSYFYDLPPSLKNITEETLLRFVEWDTSTSEIVISPWKVSNTFYLLYYNPKRNTITRSRSKDWKILMIVKFTLF